MSWPYRNRRRDRLFLFFFSSRRRHTRLQGDWSSDVCSSDLAEGSAARANDGGQTAAGSRRDFLEFGTVEIAKKLRPLRPRRAPVAFVGDGVNEIGRASCRERV